MSIRINRFIFHILSKGAEGFDVRYLAEAILADEPRRFFEELFEKHLDAVRYNFDQPDGAPEPPLKSQVRATLNGADFVTISRELTRDFAERHAPQATDGVFVIATATLDERRVVVLMKYDHIEAVELLAQAEGGAPSARYTDEALTLDERNVKKFALVDGSRAAGWDVLASDRQTPPIAEYFRAFLGVRPVRTAHEHTKDAIRVAKTWAAEADNLPPDVEPVDVQYRTVDYMRQTPQFSMGTFLDRVLGPETAANRSARAALRQRLADNDLTADFAVDPNTVTGALQKQEIVTREGVKIVMPYGRANGNVRIENTQEGRRRIIIETDVITTRH